MATVVQTTGERRTIATSNPADLEHNAAAEMVSGAERPGTVGRLRTRQCATPSKALKASGR